MLLGLSRCHTVNRRTRREQVEAQSETIARLRSRKLALAFETQIAAFSGISSLPEQRPHSDARLLTRVTVE